MSKSADIIFINIDYSKGYALHHLGTAYIIAFLRSKGVKAEQFINIRSVSCDALARSIAAKRPRMIGLTCFDRNYYLVKLLAGRLKKLLPRTMIAAGGPTATFSGAV